MATPGLLASCGGDSGTTGLESSTTSTATKSTVPSSTPSDKSIDALVETFTKLGFNETQARCLVDNMDDLSSNIGSTDTLSAKDQSTIEELMKSCGLS
ncbi:MAG: hypothetical protein WBF71_01245 [Microthrixaceae bacterium]